MKTNATKVHDMVNTEEFKLLVKKRWTFSLIMTTIMLFAYFGFILTIAFNKSIFAIKIAPNLTVGIVLGLGIIIFAWLMTGIYVSWANNNYDKDVEILKSKV